MTDTTLSKTLPPTLLSVRTQPLFTLKLEMIGVLAVGDTPAASRRVGLVAGGRFEGERLSGQVLPGGSDWQHLRADGALALDVRLHLQTDEGELIIMRYQGLRHGPADMLARIDRGEAVDPGNYYFRIAPQFETASERLGWLNRILAVGIGHRPPDGPVYNLFEVL